MGVGLLQRPCPAEVRTGQTLWGPERALGIGHEGRSSVRTGHPPAPRHRPRRSPRGARDRIDRHAWHPLTGCGPGCHSGRRALAALGPCHWGAVALTPCLIVQRTHTGNGGRGGAARNHPLLFVAIDPPGGGGGSSGLDANYPPPMGQWAPPKAHNQIPRPCAIPPPPLNRWPEAPWGGGSGRVNGVGGGWEVLWGGSGRVGWRVVGVRGPAESPPPPPPAGIDH